MPAPSSNILKFRSAALTDAAGCKLRLHSVRADRASSRRPVCLTLTAAGQEIVLELTQREAIALSEWLDEAVTHGQ
jgi:hypothetical protein